MTGLFSWPWRGVAMPVWYRPLLPMLISRPDFMRRMVWELPMEALDSGSGRSIFVGNVAVCYQMEHGNDVAVLQSSERMF